MSSREIIEERCRIIAAQFDLQGSAADETALEDRERRFRQLLIDRIVALLSRDPEQLMHILYRIDVAEDRVQRIMREVPTPEIAPALADLIIERQTAKVETRAAYRKSSE